MSGEGSGEFTGYYVEAKVATFIGHRPISANDAQLGAVVLGPDWTRISYPEGSACRHVAHGMFSSHAKAMAAAWNLVAGVEYGNVMARVVPVNVTYTHKWTDQPDKAEEVGYGGHFCKQLDDALKKKDC